MRIIRRLLGILLVVVLALVLAVGGLLGVVTGRALPHVAGDLQLPGLDGDVRVSRDLNGIAQIVAGSPHDLFIAQGYVHAQDRFWQMEVWRHIGAGRLSELFGPSTLATDRFIRTMDFRGAAQRDIDAVSQAARDALQAYADGVNGWLAANVRHLGLPFIITGLEAGLGGGIGGYRPEPWTPLDSATWAKVQAWQLGGNFDSEVFRILADAQLGDPARTDELFPAYRADRPVIVPSGLPGSGGAGATGATGATISGGAVESASTAAATAKRTGAIAPRYSAAELVGLRSIADVSATIGRLTGLDRGVGLAGDRGIGSNDWVVAASKSATGRPLLANDPHLGISMPSVWYMNGLHCAVVSADCPYDVAGVSFPGDPFVILGHNARIAWGVTNIGPDVEDLFVEKADPKDPTHYLFRDQSLPFTTRTETIKVAGGDPVTLIVRATGHGPVLNDVSDALRTLPDLYALRWTATAEPDHTLEAFMGLDAAGDFAAFRKALSVYGAPAQNFVYADVDGHIGYQAPGYIPVRADKADLGDRPVPGWDGKHEWIGRIPFNDLPRIEDPADGFIVTANNALVDAKYPYLVGREWDPGYRAARIRQLLEAAAKTGGGVTVDEMAAIQTDTRVLRADLVIPALERIEPRTADGRRVLDLVRAWDRECGVDSSGCAAYMTFEEELLRLVFDDDLGPIARDYVGQTFSWEALIALLAKPNDRFWDRTETTDRVETARDILPEALDAAGARLREALGTETGWAWGRLHTATFREATLGESGIGPLEWYFDRGPVAIPGTAGAVDNTYYQFSRAYADPYDPTVPPETKLTRMFEVTNLPSYRLDVDLGDLDGARIVQTTGQSGNPFDRHYGDLVDAWRLGRQVPLPFSSTAVDAASVAVLTLTP